MRHITLFALLYTFGMPSFTAWAGPLGGFSADETRYLVGRDTICTPVPVDTDDGSPSSATPVCQQADASAVSSLKFRRGTLQQGAGSRFAASVQGRALSIRTVDASAPQRTLISWTSFDPIARVVSVYASQNAQLVAVEYEVRFGGRLRVEVIAFVVPRTNTAGAATTSGTTTDRGTVETAEPETPAEHKSSPSTRPAVPSVTATELSKAGKKALKRGRASARKRRHKAAAKAYQRVLDEDAEHPEARFGLARTLAYRRKSEDAVKQLTALAHSGRPDAAVWLVEARFDKGFAKLRGHAGFRKATGLDRAPGEKPGLYERLVGFSSKWEQPEVKGESPEVALSLSRLKRTFRLRITSRGGGYTDNTRLKGTWQLRGDDQVIMSLPNRGAKDELMACTMQTCADGDCLRCQVDIDMAFVLQPVRR